MCTWLQEFTRDIMLYNSNRILSPGFIIAIKRDLHEKRATGGTYEWRDWLALVRRDLKDRSARAVLHALLTTRRKDGSSLLMWTQTLIAAKQLATKYGITLPNELWCDLFINQVSAV